MKYGFTPPTAKATVLCVAVAVLAIVLSPKCDRNDPGPLTVLELHERIRQNDPTLYLTNASETALRASSGFFVSDHPRAYEDMPFTRTNWPQWQGVVHALSYSPGDYGDTEPGAGWVATATILGGVRLYGDPDLIDRLLALAADPRAAAGLRAGHRYNAARAAALAAYSVGKAAGAPGDNERARLRRRALDWLRADLAAWCRLLATEPDRACPGVRQQMRQWQQDPALDGVHDPGALARLPEAERHEWQHLWADVATLRARAEGTAPEGGAAKGLTAGPRTAQRPNRSVRRLTAPRRFWTRRICSAPASGLRVGRCCFLCTAGRFP
jgi:hypothetical protein